MGSFSTLIHTAGRPIAGRVEATVKYQVPAMTAVAAADATQALPSLPPLASGGHTFASGRWSGACWKTLESDSHFDRCEGRDLEPGVAVAVIRTRDGLDIKTTVPACPVPNDVVRLKMPADKLAEDKDPTKTFGLWMTIAATAGIGNCPAFPSPIPYDASGLASFLAGTAPLIGR